MNKFRNVCNKTFATVLTLMLMFSMFQLTLKAEVKTGDGYSFDTVTKVLTISTFEGGENWKRDHSIQVTDVTEAIFTDDVTMINQGTLSGCTNLLKVTAKNVTIVYMGSFNNCTKLQTLTLPSLKDISDNAFNNCSSLKTLNISTIKPTIYGTPFDGLPSDRSISFVDADGNELSNAKQWNAAVLNFSDANEKWNGWNVPKKKPIVYSNVVVNGGSGSGKYTEGDEVMISVDSLPKGKQFENWTVISGGVTIEYPDNLSTTFVMLKEDVEVTANFVDKPELKQYSFTKGAKSIWTKGTKTDLTFTVDWQGDEFMMFNVDGKGLDVNSFAINDTMDSVTLVANYLQSLTIGEHTIEIIGINGVAKTTFTVTEGKKAPNTGDTNNTILLLGMLLASGVIIVLSSYRKKAMN